MRENWQLFLVDFGARINILFMLKVKIICELLNDRIGPPISVDYRI
jgi:hypothetical protein